MVDVQQPPLPPQPPKEMIQPPLPPEISLIPPKPPEPQNQVEDMELSDEEEAEAAPIIETRNNGNNDQLTDALSSFYSDLANIDHPGSVSQETTPNPTPPQIHSPGPSFVKESSPALSDDRSNSPSGDSLEERRKRKTKISSGISMKKKNVNSLVAKWQTIQQEVKRNK